MNKAFTGLERHGGKWLKTKFEFWGEYLTFTYWTLLTFIDLILGRKWPHTFIQKYAICMLIKNMKFGAVADFYIARSKMKFWQLVM